MGGCLAAQVAVLLPPDPALVATGTGGNARLPELALLPGQHGHLLAKVADHRSQVREPLVGPHPLFDLACREQDLTGADLEDRLQERGQGFDPPIPAQQPPGQLHRSEQRKRDPPGAMSGDAPCSIWNCRQLSTNLLTAGPVSAPGSVPSPRANGSRPGQVEVPQQPLVGCRSAHAA